MTSITRLRLAAAALGLVFGTIVAGSAMAAEDAKHPHEHEWSFEGPFGHFDKAQLQRGFQVYKEICSSCHSMSLLAYRNLADPGGPGFTEAQVKVIAAEYEVTDGPDDVGDMFERPAIPSDRFLAPFPNENAAKASNGGAYPPDLSLIAKARHDGPNYITSLLTGYAEPPEDVDVGDKSYNPYFPGGAIAMAPPLYDEAVEYTDGTPMTEHQHAQDVAAFLMWAAEPKLEERKTMGFRVLIFLIVLTGFLYMTKRKIWANIGH